MIFNCLSFGSDPILPGNYALNDCHLLSVSFSHNKSMGIRKKQMGRDVGPCQTFTLLWSEILSMIQAENIGLLADYRAEHIWIHRSDSSCLISGSNSSGLTSSSGAL